MVQSLWSSRALPIGVEATLGNLAQPLHLCQPAKGRGGKATGHDCKR